MKRYRVYYNHQIRPGAPLSKRSEVIAADNDEIATRNLKFRLLNQHPGPAVITITNVEAVEATKGVEVWICPDCRMVGATLQNLKEDPARMVARCGVQHSEHSPKCNTDALRFRSFVVTSITGDKVLFGPMH